MISGAFFEFEVRSSFLAQEKNNSYGYLITSGCLWEVTNGNEGVQ